MSRSTEGSIEERAARILNRIVENAQVDVVDVGQGGHDLELRYTDGHVEAVEVTQATSQTLRAAKAGHDKWLPEAFFLAPDLANTWHVFVTPNAQFNTLARKLPGHLAKLEEAGLGNFFVYTDAHQHPVIADLHHMGVEWGRRWSTTSDTRVVVSKPSDRTIWKEPVGDPGRYLIESVEYEAAKTDNVRKLSAAGCLRCHLFVWVDPGLYRPWRDLAIGLLPVRPPNVPHVVSTVWAATIGVADALIVWTATPPEPWKSHVLGSGL